MITEIQHKLINKLRNVMPSKSDIVKLKDIYTKETGQGFDGCFCSSVQRRIFKKTFYEWYNNEYPQTPEV